MPWGGANEFLPGTSMNERRETVLINGRPLSYRVRKNKRARHLRVQVSSRDGVMITLPWRVGYGEVPRLLQQWGDWLDVQADRYDVRLGPQIRQYGTGSKVMVLGKLRHLTVRPLPSDRVRPTAELAEDTLVMGLPLGEILDLRPALEKYLRRLARSHLPPRIDSWAQVIGHTPGKILIGERTTRWGSCSAAGTVSLCYRLVMAPPEVIDAVVAHEICHLVHLDHGPGFHALLDRVCPGHGRASQWLKEHHGELIL